MRNMHREQASRCYEYCRLTLLMFSRRPSSSGMCFAKTNSQKLSLGHSTTSISPLEMRSLLAEVIEGAEARSRKKITRVATSATQPRWDSIGRPGARLDAAVDRHRRGGARAPGANARSIGRLDQPINEPLERSPNRRCHRAKTRGSRLDAFEI